MNRQTITVTAVAVIALSTAVGCSNRANNGATIATQADTDQQQQTYGRTQPMPRFNWSQYRQTVIDVETAEAQGTATTSFFYNQGVDHPVFTCPSIGFPVPITSQLTNPQQITYGNNPGGGTTAGVVGQAEPNGTFTGDSSGTFVTCVKPDGEKWYKYWEGYVGTDGGPAHWDQSSKTEVLDGPSSIKVVEQPK